MSDIKEILAERKNQHGDFSSVATVTCELMDVVQNSKNHQKLHDEEYLALVMIQHKVARILCGDPHFVDHWVDIGGYATLVVTTLQHKYAGKLRATTAEDPEARAEDRGHVA